MVHIHKQIVFPSETKLRKYKFYLISSNCVKFLKQIVFLKQSIEDSECVVYQ